MWSSRLELYRVSIYTAVDEREPATSKRTTVNQMILDFGFGIGF